MRWIAVIRVLLVLMAVLASPPSRAEPGLAIVIGNGDYDRDKLDLANPNNDATIMTYKLRGRGFEVQQLLDASRADVETALAAFSTQAARMPVDASHFIYFSGHAAQIEGVNYLFLRETDSSSAASLIASSITLQSILEAIAALPSRVNFVVLDACRENRFGLPIASGLAAVEAPSNGFVAFSTAPGMVAYDGDGQNSRFTAALALALGDEFASAQDVFQRSYLATVTASEGDQQPEFIDNLSISGADPWKRQAIGRARVGSLRGMPTPMSLPLLISADRAEPKRPIAGQLSTRQAASMSEEDISRFATAMQVALDSGAQEMTIKPDYTHESYPALLRSIVELPEARRWTQYDLALFLAHAAHETYQFQALAEYGTSAYFRRYDGDARLGNGNPGDGERFRGRGLLQIRGRREYQALSKEMGIDLVENPDLLVDDKVLSLRASEIVFNRWRDDLTLDPVRDLVDTTRAHLGSTRDVGLRGYYFLRLLSALSDLEPGPRAN